MTTVLEINNLGKAFGSGETRVNAVDHVSLAIAQDEILLIMGPSGSGKTTFLSMLGGLLKADSGAIVLDGVDITRMGEQQLPDVRVPINAFRWRKTAGRHRPCPDQSTQSDSGG